MSNALDVKAITKKFFAAYDAHDVDGMLACAPRAPRDATCPTARTASMPIRGGLENIWRGFPHAVPDFGVEIVELIEGEGNAVTVQALLGGDGVPADDRPWRRKERRGRSHRPMRTSSATTRTAK